MRARGAGLAWNELPSDNPFLLLSRILEDINQVMLRDKDLEN